MDKMAQKTLLASSIILKVCELLLEMCEYLFAVLKAGSKGWSMSTILHI